MKIPRKENIVLTGPEDPVDYYSMPIVGRLYIRRLRMILSLVPGGRARVLDIGYGSGILFPELASRYERLCGIDVHLKGRDVKRAMEREGITVGLCSGSVLALPYKDETFDCVVVASVLEHMEDLDGALKEVSRVMVNNGAAIFGFPNSAIWMKAAFRLIGFREVEERHVSSLPRILSALGKHFVMEKRKTLPGFFPVQGSLYVVCMCTKSRSKEEEKKHGALIADKARSLWGHDTLMGQERIKRRSNAVLALAGVKTGMRVLELGSGTGSYTEAFSASGARIVGIDISMDMLTRARDHLGGQGANFLVADAETMPFKAGAFDAVVGNAVLHHVDLGKCLGEIMRVLRPGGAFAFTEPNMLNPMVFVQKNIPPVKKYMCDSPGETAFIRWRVRTLLREKGAGNVRAVPFDFMHPRLPGRGAFLKGLSSIMEHIPVLKEAAGSILISGRK